MTWLYITAILALLPLAVLMLEGPFWCFCWCFCKLDNALQERHWRKQIAAEDIERLRRAFDETA
ncbi:MAG: hypothetical protein EBR88_08610 [Betaproteobacteria bacterium]|nr:hypothetical protein [Betaproteobacteria bacterium]